MSKHSADINKTNTPPSGKKHGGTYAPPKAKNFKASIKKLIGYLKPYYVIIIIAILFAAGGTTFSILGPKFIGKITDEIEKAMRYSFENQTALDIDFGRIAQIAYMLIAFYLLSLILNFTQYFLIAGASTRTCKKLRSEISQKINLLPLKYYDNHSIGDILSRVTNDVDTIGQTLSQALPQFVVAITQIVGFTIVMSTLGTKTWILTLVPIGIIPLSLLLLMLIIKFSQRFFVRQQQSLGALNGHIEEIYSAHTVVSVFNYTAKAKQKFSGYNGEISNATWKSQFISGLMFPGIHMINNFAYIGVCVLAGYFAIQGWISASIVLTFVLYVRQFHQPVNAFAQIANTLQSTAAASERVFEFLQEPEMEAENGKLSASEKVAGNVTFQNVNFGYSEDKQIIYNFNLDACKGQKIAIVGPTGAGKTTIVNLLMRFYEIDSGAILLDNADTKEMKRGDVRRQFGMVLQDTWIFEGTIRENVAYSNAQATDDEISAACRAANIDHFIRTLPDGYNTVLDNESSLSAGQKQLLTIARAMLQNAPMLILDEATSSVDTRTEILIQEAMDRLMSGRTSFVIAHRLSTIKNADTILVMKDGNIIETGNHEKLLAQNGFYTELYNSQFSKNYQDIE